MCSLGLAQAGDFSPPEPAPTAETDVPRSSALAQAGASPDARYLGAWLDRQRDSAGKAFAIVDKKDARLYVFDELQRLVGSSPVLLGSAYGDESASDVGRQAQQARVAPADRTTPAGRFVSEPGRNLGGEDVVWLDYGAAFAIHRLRADAAQERRARRLATPSPDDNRMSLGCVVVPVAFYERVVRPLLGSRRGIVYVLPETRPVQALWPPENEAIARAD